MAKLRVFRFVTRFLQLEAASGLVLLAVSVVAMVAANSIFTAQYQSFVGQAAHAVNDGLMAIFFLLVGLEIKREMLEGELADWRTALLPLAAALGGVLVPALIYTAFNHGTDAMRGWAIPTATDIAFSLGVLSLFGSRVNPWLKVFLMALAIIDDLAAVIIIATFYTQEVSTGALLIAAGCAVALYALNQAGNKNILLYAAVGVVLWYALLKSGVHATIAGVILGFMIPMQSDEEGGASLGKKLIEKMHPWSAYGIMPIFAFVNAGIVLEKISISQVTDYLPLGIAIGLILGKPVGISLAVFLLHTLKIARLPKSVDKLQFAAVAVLAGIGFTMSLFIGGLAFFDSERLLLAKIGIIMGSLFSAAAGCLVMGIATRRRVK